MAKCRGCGEDTGHKEVAGGPGPMHWDCEVKRCQENEQEQLDIANQLAEENDALKAKLAAAEADQARYRWLRRRVKAHPEGEAPTPGEPGCLEGYSLALDVSFPVRKSEVTLDEEIDAVMREEG